MQAIPAATIVVLNPEERQALEALAGSRKSEARMQQCARIVLLAAGLVSRAIARAVGCTPGTASKWRVRYARDRMAGLDETGKRGAAAKQRPRVRSQGGGHCGPLHDAARQRRGTLGRREAVDPAPAYAHAR
jgi:transposase-like protein